MSGKLASMSFAHRETNRFEFGDIGHTAKPTVLEKSLALTDSEISP